MNGRGASDTSSGTVNRYEIKGAIFKVRVERIYPSGTQGKAGGCHHPSENGRKDKCEKKKRGESHRCRIPSNRFDFFTAVICPLVPEIEKPPCRRTFITLPNSPLPSSPISTNSRSNLPGCA